MAEVFVYINATFFFAMGVLALARPTHVTRLFGLTDIPMTMRNEVRAVYGGFGIVVSGLLLAAMHDESIRLGAWIAVAVALFGMAGGRIISFAIDRVATVRIEPGFRIVGAKSAE